MVIVSEADIIEGCKKGKSKFQDLLYQQYAPILLGACMRYIRNKMEAEDVLQDAFIKIFINVKTFNYIENGALLGWMKRVVINTALNHIRDHQKHLFHLDVEEIDVVEDYEQSNFPDIKPEILLKFIQELPRGYNLVFNLYVFENFNHQEIAEQLNISINTSKTQLMKARIVLKKKINEYLESNNLYTLNAVKYV